jgi:ankyrin repeat protein
MAQFSTVQKQWVSNFLQSKSGGATTSAPLPGSTAVFAQNVPPPAAPSATPIDDLTKAIEADNLVEVQRLIGTGIKLDDHDSNGMSPLTQAAKSQKTNSVQIADELIQGGATVDFANKDRDTPLIVAAQSDNQPIAQLLLSKNAGVDLQDSQHRSPLFIAVENGKPPLRDLFLQSGANPDTSSGGGRTVLMEAASKGDLDSVKALVHSKANVNKTATHGGTALMEASDPAIVEFLLQNKADPNVVSKTNGETALMTSARINNRAAGNAVGKVLLKHKAEVNVQDSAGRTALINAAQAGNSDFVNELVKDSRVNVNLKTKDGSTALIEAVKSGDAKTVEAVLKFKKVALDEIAKGKTALMEAASSQYGGLVAVLLSKSKPKLDLTDADGNTALILAAQHGDVDGVKALLKARANKTIKNGKGHTALDIATELEKTAGSPNSALYAAIVALLQPAPPKP